MSDDARIFAEWRRLSGAGVNNRACAAALGLSEAALLATGCGTVSTRLEADPMVLLDAARALGRVKFIVRNDHAVLERPGELVSLSEADGELVAIGTTFELRVGSSRARSAFALEEAGAAGVKRSLQVFDATGTTLFKIVVRDEGASSAFRAIAARLRLEEASAPESVPTALTSPSTGPLLLRSDTLATFLRRAAELAVDVGITVRNGGASLQAVSHFRRVKRSTRAPWINVLDPELDLHLYEARICSLAVEGAADGSRQLHWLADDGSAAVSTRVSAALAESVVESVAGRSGLRERALQA